MRKREIDRIVIKRASRAANVTKVKALYGTIAPPEPETIPDIVIPDKLPPLTDPFWNPYKTDPEIPKPNDPKEQPVTSPDPDGPTDKPPPGKRPGKVDNLMEPLSIGTVMKGGNLSKTLNTASAPFRGLTFGK